MNIKHVFEDSRIVMLEKDIARINEYCQYSDEEKFVMKHLLKKRCNVLWQLNVYDDETKQLLIGFNDALRKACTQLYHRTMTVYQEYLHLIQPFHNLYDHCYFSLYDLIYVREFNLEVHVEFDDKVKY